MELEAWTPRQELSKQEQILMKQLARVGKLFAFLREHRQELLDDAFQRELGKMYRDTGAGRAPVPPAVLALVLLLQGYEGISDARAVQMSVVDLRWQMVLGCLGATTPLFSQGALCDFRARLIAHDMDRRLLERTVELARTTKAFDWKKVPKSLRVAIDSMPLEGAGRVEDTINLLAHAARKALVCAADLLGRKAAHVATAAGAPLLATGQSIKRALDVEWSVPAEKAEALCRLVEQLDALETWIREQLPEQMDRPPLAEHLDTLRQLREQDLEPDPSGGGTKIRRGVAADRRVSIEDPEMRHGRKSKSKRFNGYRRHIAADLDTELILACAVTPANRPEEEAAPLLRDDIEQLPGRRRAIDRLYIDRGYINSTLVQDVLARRGEIVCKPWVSRNGKLFAKKDFVLNMRDRTIRCPAGEIENFEPGTVVEFDPEACARCQLRPSCTMAAKTGRTVNIADDEQLQVRLRKLIATPAGRRQLRERVAVEHRLAHLGRKQGRRARYRGTRNNLFDTRRAAAVVNLETLQRKMAVAA